MLTIQTLLLRKTPAGEPPELDQPSIPDSHEKQTKSAFHSASARRSLHETASALFAQMGGALSGAFPRKSIYFLLENSIKKRGQDVRPALFMCLLTLA